MRCFLLALLLPLLACAGDDREWWEEPPEGMRWVGHAGAVVAVPDWWTTGETQCGEPVEDTVYFAGVTYRCTDPADPETVAEVSALAVSEGPEFDVTIADEGDGDADQILDSERELPDGVTTVPLDIDGSTPTWGATPRVARSLVTAIEEAGLTAEVEVLDPDPSGDVADLPRGSLLDVEPALGTPIRVGDRVKVTVMGTSVP